MSVNTNAIQQGRASFAYNYVNNFVQNNNNSDKQKEYKSHIKHILSLIQTSGLAPAFAFAYSKGGTYKNIYNDTSDYLKQSKNIPFSIDKKDDLINVLINLNPAEYRIATREIREFFIWLKRFADGLIESD